MRRFLLCLMATVVVLGCLALVVEAKQGKGAVKTTLNERLDPADTFGSGPVAGWVILNTNADGQLIVNVSLKDGAPSTDFTVWVVVNGVWLEADLGDLRTNRQGKGNENLKLTLSDYVPAVQDLETVPVRVVVDNWDPLNMPTPYIGYATDLVDVPLKK